MKTLIISFLFFLYCIPSASTIISEDLRSLMIKLDSLIEQKQVFTELKEARIDQLRTNKARTIEEKYWLNKLFYEEFFVYNSDSAMVYVNQNLKISERLGNKEWMAEWKIKKSFLLSATGLLKEALDELENIHGNQLSPELRVEYYGQMMYLYSHFGLYSVGEQINLRDEYYQKEKLYKDSINATITPNDPLYLWYKGWYLLGTDEATEIRDKLEIEIQHSSLQTRHDAMNAYILSYIYRVEGNQQEFLKNLFRSAIADVRVANKDIASLEELAKELFNLGDIDHAYTYINYCLQNAQLYRNRVRVVGISEIQDSIHHAYLERNVRQEKRLHYFLVVVSILSVVLMISLFYIYRQMKKLARSRSQLNDVNLLLNQHVTELSEAQTSLAHVNEQLKALNSQLKDANYKLSESNYVKEEYIGYVFAICSNYISKLDGFRKDINRRIKAKKFEEVRLLTDTPTMAQNELKEFYHNFDAIFLHVYPDFVSDFNSLLLPGEKIVLKEGELLNTELRIYALVRLGINDSVKIAEFLHCSPQTVYNNRLKCRNKSIIPKEQFASVVRSLGKMEI